jgi:prepilin-type processing-associated H-X9-DG protein
MCPAHPGAVKYHNDGSYSMNSYTMWNGDTNGSNPLGCPSYGSYGAKNWPNTRNLRDVAGSIYMADNTRINPVPVDPIYMNSGGFSGFVKTMSNGRHRGGANFLYFDGHVQFLTTAHQAGSAEFNRAVDVRPQL